MDEYAAAFPSSYASVRCARRALTRFAQCAGIFGEALDDFEHAIGEALANAVEHGHRDGANFTVRANVHDGGVLVEVKDGGGGFAGWNATEQLRPPSSSPRGFGIFLMRALMDCVEFGDGGSCVRLCKKLPVAEREGNRREA